MRRVLVCGDRVWRDPEPIRAVLAGLTAVHRTVTVISGAAPGADTLAGEVAAELGIPVDEFPPRPPGDVGARRDRNARMLAEGRPDEVWAFCDALELSPGTAHMVALAREAGVPVRLVGNR